VTGFDMCSMDSKSLGLCPMDSESLWLVIIPKSKDQFMVRPPMKTMSLHGYDLA
jgi:hypothetical protein